MPNGPNLDLAAAMADSTEITAHLGPLIRLWGLMTSQLPDAAATADDIAPFLISILQEAVPFADSVAPKAAAAAQPSTSTASTSAGKKPTWKAKGTKSHADSAAKVELLERVVPTADLELLAARNSLTSYSSGKVPPETWVCRRSLHRDAAARGTASWAEFRGALKDRHAESEDAFTPGVVGNHRALSWDCAGVEAEEGGVRWGDFTLRVEEMRHRIGKPLLKDRTFPVLQMTCAALPATAPSAVPVHPATVLDDTAAAVVAVVVPPAAPATDLTEPDLAVITAPAPAPAAAVPTTTTTTTTPPDADPHEFLVVSITVVDFKTAPQAQLSRSKGVVVGAYASVERVRRLPAGGPDGHPAVEWIMATASDARGVLPMWVQHLAVPAQIAKDVPLFLAWVAGERTAAAAAAGTGGLLEPAGEKAAAAAGGEEAKLMPPLVPVKAGAEEAVLPGGPVENGHAAAAVDKGKAVETAPAPALGVEPVAGIVVAPAVTEEGKGKEPAVEEVRNVPEPAVAPPAAPVAVQS